MDPTRPYAAFFYGTLMHPEILKRVIGNDGTHLKICSAILLVSTIRYSPPKPLDLYCSL